MRTPSSKEPDWVRPFLGFLAEGDSALRAAELAGVCRSTAYNRRRQYAWFADAWIAALAKARAEGKAQAARAPGSGRKAWVAPFLEALAETSHVQRAAAIADVPLATAYRRRRADAGFAEQWRAALLEGYENLEMELLGYLRDPDPQRKMDVAGALRLLAAHRESMRGERARRHQVSVSEVRASIERKVQAMRVEMAQLPPPQAERTAK